MEEYESRTCWKRRTRMEKHLFATCFLALIIVLTLLFAVNIVRPLERTEDLHKQSLQDVDVETPKKNNSIDNCLNGNNVCLTRSCIDAAANILQIIDESVEPCDDFYRFACGNFIKNSHIPDDKTWITTSSGLVDELQLQIRNIVDEPINDKDGRSVKLIKNYYQACTNRRAIEDYGLDVMRDLMKQFGGWPVLEGNAWNDGDFDWKNLMYQYNEMGIQPGFFVDFYVGADFKNSSRRCIQLDQPQFGLNRDILIKGREEKVVEAYFDYMVDVAVEFGCERSVAERELALSLEFEIQLAYISMPKEERRNITNLYNPISIGQLQEKYSAIPWLQIINNLLPRDVRVDNKETLILISPRYVTWLIKLIDNTSKRTQANYAIWRAVSHQISYLSENVIQKQFNFYHVVSGITERQNRWKECVDEVTNSLPILVSSAYVRRYFPREAKSTAIETVKYIKAAFDRILNAIDWMDELTRKSALEKSRAITDHIGYPDELLDDKKLDAYFETLEIHPDRYFKSHLNIEIHSATLGYKRLREPVNKTDWIDHGDVVQVNAFYHPLENSITFPAGILQGPYFNKDRPRYMNFAAIGSVVGHEITHGFDDMGRQFDKNGNLVDWWANSTKEAFLQRAQCLIYQYGNYTVPGTDLNLNGIHTQGENIADNGGAKEAYLAYRDWVAENGPELKLPGLNYAPEQIFWISLAMNWCSNYRSEMYPLLIASDSHSINEFRVLGPFSNSDYFARDFNCPSGSKMNPIRKCSVW